MINQGPPHQPTRLKLKDPFLTLDAPKDPFLTPAALKDPFLTGGGNPGDHTPPANQTARCAGRARSARAAVS
jgi:hypothetical protein